MNRTVELMFAAACLAAGVAWGETAKFGSVVGYWQFNEAPYKADTSAFANDLTVPFASGVAGASGTGAAENGYDTVQVRAFETAAGVDSGSYLTLYYGNGAAVGGTSVGKDLATSGLPFYASLASVMGSSFSYVVELFNDGAKVGQSESLLFTEAMAKNYVATVTSTGSFPGMATWSAGGFSAAPEPNSAVLLLLGCAALALRRKKAEVPA